MQVRLKLYMMDLVKKGNENRLDVHSDTYQNLLDIKAYIWKDFSIEILPAKESNITPYWEKFDDEVAGWVLDLDLDLDNFNNVCDIPGLYPSGVTFSSGAQFFNVQLTNYLPLTGGQLTGNLTGTSADFAIYYSAGTPLETIIWNIADSFS